MDHSLRGYLERRTTEELENVLELYQDDDTDVGRDLFQIAQEILRRREAQRPAPPPASP